MTSPTQPQTSRSANILQLVRALFHLAAVITLTVWGFVSWPMPLPGIFTGIGFFVVAALVWALFLSPRPVLRTDRFGQALVELLLLAGAVAAMLFMGMFWVWPALFGVVGAVIGFVISSRTK